MKLFVYICFLMVLIHNVSQATVKQMVGRWSIDYSCKEISLTEDGSLLNGNNLVIGSWSFQEPLLSFNLKEDYYSVRRVSAVLQVSPGLNSGVEMNRLALNAASKYFHLDGLARSVSEQLVIKGIKISPESLIKNLNVKVDDNSFMISVFYKDADLDRAIVICKEFIDQCVKLYESVDAFSKNKLVVVSDANEESYSFFNGKKKWVGEVEVFSNLLIVSDVNGRELVFKKVDVSDDGFLLLKKLDVERFLK